MHERIEFLERQSESPVRLSNVTRNSLADCDAAPPDEVVLYLKSDTEHKHEIRVKITDSAKDGTFTGLISTTNVPGARGMIGLDKGDIVVFRDLNIIIWEP